MTLASSAVASFGLRAGLTAFAGGLALGFSAGLAFGWAWGDALALAFLAAIVAVAAFGVRSLRARLFAGCGVVCARARLPAGRGVVSARGRGLALAQGFIVETLRDAFANGLDRHDA